MNNTKILKDRWQKIDKQLSVFYAKKQRIDSRLFDELQSILDGINFSYEDLYKIASKQDVKRLKERVKNIGKLDGYVGYKVNTYLNKKRLLNSELLMCMLMLAYYNQYQETKIEENILFEEIQNITIEQSSLEVRKVLPKKEYKSRPLTIPKLFVISLLALPFYNGNNWTDFNDGNIVYNVGQLYKKIKVEMQQENVLNVYDGPLKKEIDKQNNAYFRKKKEIDKNKIYDDTYVGYLDNAVVYLTNQVALETYKIYGIKKVKFIAEIDKKTTEMCRTLNGQIFDIEGPNIFDRYSSADGRMVTYDVKGLEVGANLPPIDNHYHHCRSTIYPIKN